MKIFDSHCHLDDQSFAQDLDAVIERARNAGVTRMMTIGVNKKTSAQAFHWPNPMMVSALR